MASAGSKTNQKEVCTRASGKTVKKMGMAVKLCQMEVIMSGNLKMAYNMGKALFIQLRVPSKVEFGKMVNCEIIFGLGHFLCSIVRSFCRN